MSVNCRRLIGCLIALSMILAGAAWAADTLTPLDARQVRLGGELGRRMQVTVENNLLVLDAEKDFLAPFRKPDRAGGYVGLGKLIDAAVRFANATGDPRVLALGRRLVAETLKLQAPDGYIGLLKPEARVTQLWDIHEMAYLIGGLTADYRFFKNKAALEGAKRLADYLIARWPTEPSKLPGAGEMTLHMAVTGTELALLALHQASGEKKYLDFCMKTRALGAWNARLVTGRFTPLEGHAYAHLSRCVAQLRVSRLLPNPELRRPACDVMEFITKKEGMTIPGEVGDHECWHDNQEGTINLGESCATAYLLRFLDEELRIGGDALHGDLMERVIYNGLFAAQSPDGRRIRYYTPLEGPRSYFSGDTYCCPNNYRRIIAELPEFVYYQSADGVTVNLYTASTALLTLGGGGELKLTQRTDYPAGEKVELTVEPARAARFTLRLRLPKWCGAPAVSVNGAAVKDELIPGEFLTLERQWKAGDKVVVRLPMQNHLVRGRVAQAGRVALMRGPQLFGLSRKRPEALKDVDLRLVVLDPRTVEGPVADASVRPGGQALRARAWRPGAWYPAAKCDYDLTLTEYADPDCEAVYFKVPNPNDPIFVDDELFVQ